jgi:predicted NBD/HSP70 family sugar kinase
VHGVKIKQQAIAGMERSLVQHVRVRDGVSRVELARQLQLAPSTVGLYVDRLIDEGYLLEGNKAPRTSGRPPTLLELNPKAGHFVGVDFDARQIAITLVDFSQRVVEERQATLASNAAQVTAQIQELIASISAGRRLLGIGLAVPGVINSRLGVALHYEHISGWRNVSLVQQLTPAFHVPIHLENNIRAMALAEQWFGEARCVEQFVCLGIRSGIGAGVVVNGRLHRGSNDLAGEIGGWPCEAPNGNTDQVLTLEQVASVRSILAHLTESMKSAATTSLMLRRNVLTLDELLRCAAESDPLTLETLHRAACAVGRVISQLSLLLNPEKVIIAGPLVELEQAFLEPMRETAKRLSLPPHARLPEIVASRFGAFGGALGAAALAVHHWKPVR